MFTAQEMQNFLGRGHKILDLPRSTTASDIPESKKNVTIWFQFQFSEMNFACFLQYMCMVLTSWLLLPCFLVRKHERDRGVMSHELEYKKWQNHSFCGVLLFGVGAVGRCLASRLWRQLLGTSASTNSSIIYNQRAGSAREKNDHPLNKTS